MSDQAPPLRFRYRNHRGEERVRLVNPIRPWFGSTAWHPTPQWFLRARDVETGAMRDFAWLDILEVLPSLWPDPGSLPSPPPIPE